MINFGKQFFEIEHEQELTVSLIANKYKVPVKIRKNHQRLWFSFGFNKPLMAEVKIMEGAKWHGFEDPPIKKWSVADSVRNRYRICFLQGLNPQKWYDQEIKQITTKRPSYNHQTDLLRHGYTYHYGIWASETGTGKTLAAIELIEASGFRDCFYVAPKSALNATKLEFEKWQSKVMPTFMTYDGLRGLMEKWESGNRPPPIVIFDEASRLKNHAAKRTMAAQHLANAIRDEWGYDGYVILMSGTPAPKSPVDWWSLCEIAMPGFLREGSPAKFRDRLAIMGEGSNDAGQVFAKLLAWKDDNSKCDKCGKPKIDLDHDPINMTERWFHEFVPCVNEVEKLYRRMSGVVEVKLKKNCLELPDKIYKIIDCKPNESIINAAKILMASGHSVVKTLTLLRELSDGFQYQAIDIGTEQCPLCNGARTVEEFAYVGPDEDYERIMEAQYNGQNVPPGSFEKVTQACKYCSGSGEVTKYARESVQIPCPKEEALSDIIDQHDEIGRLVCYAGFTGSVDRCVSTFIKEKWEVIRVDGRGWSSSIPGTAQDLLRIFMYDFENHPKLAFVAQPGAAGMGLNLTVSPTIVFYSNDFNGESRTQAEDRIHRIGMDKNRGATIIDLFHLPTDAKVLENLRKKKRLQDITLGEFKTALEEINLNVKSD